MAVTPGNTETSPAVLPPNWRSVDLSQLCALQRGFDITEATRSPGIVPVYSSSGLSYYHNKPMVLPPGVVTGRKGILGKVFLVNEPFWPHDTTLWVKDFKGNHPAYVALVLQSFHLERLDAATSVPTLNRNNLAGHQINVPISSAEQRIIAEALSDADALIESLQKLIAKKRQLKQGAMQELLTGKRRLPGFKTTSRKQTEMGLLPGDWELIPLGQRLSKHPAYGINAPAIEFDSRYPTYLRITDITDEGRFAESTKASVDHRESSCYLLEVGDVVLARTGASVGKSYRYDPKDGPLVFAGFLIRVRPDSQLLVPEYLSFFLQTQPYWRWVKVNSMRSGQPGINGREYAALPIPLPRTRDEQVAIASVLFDMEAEITALTAKLSKARQIKHGMMQELLTGRIRLV